MIKVELGDHVPLIGCPFRRWPGGDFCYVVLEQKALDLIGGGTVKAEFSGES